VSREQELGFVILNEVTHSVLRKKLNICQQEPSDFTGTDLSPYGCSRDGMAAVPCTTFGTAWQGLIGLESMLYIILEN
jgi:hypothetical protein